jgi:hypothetical protein
MVKTVVRYGVYVCLICVLLSNITRSKNLELISGTITVEGEKKMKIAAYYRPPKQVSDIDNKLFKEEVNESSHVSVPRIMSGFDDSINASSKFPFFLKL